MKPNPSTLNCVLVYYGKPNLSTKTYAERRLVSL